VYAYLQKEKALELILLALQEDIGDGDHTSLASIPEDRQHSAHLLVKENGRIAGIEAAKWVCEVVDPSINFDQKLTDGLEVRTGDIAFVLTGNSRSVLRAERVLLNIMQRMSGIASYTQSLVKCVKDTKVKLLDTRKTTPNFRLFEKWAVKIGGGENHRYGLFDMILIKDNHIDVAGGVKQALSNTQHYLSQGNRQLEIEIEVRNLDELKEVIDWQGCKVKRVMLDNMSSDMIRKAVALVNGKMETEISGGVNEENLRAFATTGVDYISIGKLTHSVKSLDLSLKAFK
jgi:nicotinate-nucleotide pyrophosphorylase (carboxylating)